jgi:hypothetical protein
LFNEQSKRPREAVATWGRFAGGYVEGNVRPNRKPLARQITLERDLRYRFSRLLQRAFDVQPLRRPMIKSGYVDIFFGTAGVVVRPEFFDDEAFNIPECARHVDDVWLSAQLARNEIPLFCPRRLPCPISTDASSEQALLASEFTGYGRQALNRRAAIYCQKKYAIWRDQR